MSAVGRVASVDVKYLLTHETGILKTNRIIYLENVWVRFASG